MIVVGESGSGKSNLLNLLIIQYILTMEMEVMKILTLAQLY